MPGPLVLDLDGATLPLPGEERLALGHWQESLRFGCRLGSLAAFGQEIGSVLDDGRPLFIGSGDFHHLTYQRIRRITLSGGPLRVVVLDNHPDNMRYPFGIHCGSWVSHVARLNAVTRVDVIGIGSGDVDGWRALENRLGPLWNGRVHYWCLHREVTALRRLGVRTACSHDSPTKLLRAFAETLDATPTYLSIDKDVLAEDVVHTNWDQGHFQIEDLAKAIQLVSPTLVGCDVVGEVSAYRYHSRFKRLLAGLDGQLPPPAALLSGWQIEQQAINRQILGWLADRPR